MRKRLRKKLARKEAESFFFDDIRTARMHGASVWSYFPDELYLWDKYLWGKAVYTAKPKCRGAKRFTIPYLKEIERRFSGEVTRYYIGEHKVAWY